MRELHCAHVLTAADAPAVGAHTIRIDGDRIAAVEAAKPASQAPVGAAGARQRPRPCPRHLDHGLRRGRQAAGNLAALSRAAAVGRSLSRGRGVAVAQRARRCRRRHGALHPRAGPDRSADRGGRGRARRRATSACASASRSRCATAIRWSTARRSRSWPRCRRRRASEIRQRFLRPPLPVEEQIALVDAVAAAAANPMFDVQYGPQAVQWCTHELLRSDRARPRSEPAGASTCICWRPAPSAPGSTPIIPTAS